MDKIQGRLVSDNIPKHIAQKTKSVPFNPAKNCGYSLYNCTCPVGLNYYTNNVSFGGINLNEATKLKEKFAQKGLKYLLPNETWNNNKIFSTIKSVTDKFGSLSKNKNLNCDGITKILSAVLPAAVLSNIAIKDFKDLEKDLRKQGLDEDDIEDYMECEALTDTDVKSKKTNIYLNFDKGNKSHENEIYLKSAFAHELKHALTAQCTNNCVEDIYNLSKYNDEKLEDKVNKFFIDYSRMFQCKDSLENIDLTPENMAINTYGGIGLKFKSLEDLRQGIDKSMTALINQTKFLNAKDYPKDFFETKTFWNMMKHYAQDEKEAYQTDNIYREINGDTSTPVTTEIRSLLYAEMENYFDKKAKNAKA